jgi:nicotinate phosphoribosyltransferase
MLDDAGLPDVRIVASGGLDEYELADLTTAAAPIDLYGVGTRMGVAADAPSLDSAYKLVVHDGIPVMKLSPGKRTSPGAKQVWRPRDGGPDVLALREEDVPGGYEALLEPVMVHGRRLDRDFSTSGARRRCTEDLDRLPAPARNVRRPEPPEVTTSAALTRLTDSLIRARSST